MKVIIYGSKGWIASYVIKEFIRQNIYFYCSINYVYNEKDIESELLEI